MRAPVRPDALLNTLQVVFCSDAPTLTFRQPIEADFLESGGRQNTLTRLLQNEIQLPAKSALNASLILTDATAFKLAAWQKTGVSEHIQVMRQVLPLDFWLFGR